MNRAIGRFSILFLTIFCVLGCVRSEDKGDYDFRLGILIPAGGENADAAESMARAVKIAAKADGAKVFFDEMKYRDALDGVNKFNKLADNGVIGIIAGYSSDEVTLFKTEAERRKVAMFLPVASHDALTENSSYVVRTCYNDTLQGRALGYFARYQKRCERMVLLINLDEKSVFAREVAGKIGQYFSDNGGKVAGRIGFRESESDFSMLAASLTSISVDVVVVPALPHTAAKIIRALRQAGFRGVIICPDSVSEAEFFEKLSRDDGEIYFASAYSPVFLSESAMVFRNLMLENGIREPGDAEAQGYDSWKLIYRATKFENATRRNLAQKIRTMSIDSAAGGSLKMNSDGNAERLVFINRVEYGDDGSIKGKLLQAVDSDRVKESTIGKDSEILINRQ